MTPPSSPTITALETSSTSPPRRRSWRRRARPIFWRALRCWPRFPISLSASAIPSSPARESRDHEESGTREASVPDICVRDNFRFTFNDRLRARSFVRYFGLFFPGLDCVPGAGLAAHRRDPLDIVASSRRDRSPGFDLSQPGLAVHTGALAPILSLARNFHEPHLRNENRQDHRRDSE